MDNLKRKPKATGVFSNEIFYKPGRSKLKVK